MLVRAIKTGFYDGQLRTPGTESGEFEIKDKTEMGKWMAEVVESGDGKTAPVKGKAKAAAKAEADDDLA